MSSSPALKWVVALLLCVTLVWKLPARPDDLSEHANLIARFLSDRQFDVTVTKEDLDGMPLIRASKGSCQLVLARSSAYGWNRDIIRDLRTGSDRLVFVFRGRLYSEQPMWLTVFYHVWSRGLVQLGLLPHEGLVIAVIASESCALDSLPWSELSHVS